MIFVTVGMHHQGFDRLIRAMDEVAAQISEPVVMQIGSASYEPRCARWFRFDTQEKVDEYCAAARVIVGHAGAGTALSALHCSRPLVLVPRRASCQEAIDDHQFELGHALAAEHKAVLVEEPDARRLLDGIEQAASLQINQRPAQSLAEAIQKVIQPGDRKERRQPVNPA